MDPFSLTIHYFWWHYTKALKDIFTVTTNVLWFLVHLFSLRLLLRTLISPWRRLQEGKPAGFHPGIWFSSLLVNTIMRLLGFVIRLSFIVVGVAILVIALIASGLFVISWLTAPIWLVWTISNGLSLII